MKLKVLNWKFIDYFFYKMFVHYQIVRKDLKAFPLHNPRNSSNFKYCNLTLVINKHLISTYGANSVNFVSFRERYCKDNP